ncbi:CD225/dispanin family protein [Streptomyces sp. BH106]|uniref:CD225/dispanin family protein n=1 Tax=Streptomyces sp. BH106 TaxID=3410409 RepID=UPI003CEE0514
MSNPQQGPDPNSDWGSNPWVGGTPHGPQQPPPHPGPPPPPGGGNPFIPTPPPNAGPKQTRTYMLPAVLVTLFCFLPTGIAAIVFATQVTSKLNAYDYGGAQVASNRAKTLCIVSAAIGVVVLLIIIVSSASGGSSEY